MSGGPVTQQRGQAAVEFGLTIGLLMLLIVLTAQVAIFLHYRGSLDTAAREGAFEAALVGHTPEDGRRTTLDLWAKLEPAGGAVQVEVRRQGNLVVVDASASALGGLPVRAHAVHTVERFQPGVSTP